MEKINFIVPKDLEPYINCIMVQQNNDADSHTNLPYHADGYPGIMYIESESPAYLLPREKHLSELFLYGQTLEPISIDIKGKFSFIIMQLYPFASKYLLGIDPRILNDDCYDLLTLSDFAVDPYLDLLHSSENTEEQIGIITKLMLKLIKKNTKPPEDTVMKAVHIILQKEGQVAIKEVTDRLYVTERTFERKFMKEIGLTPKQFAKIIQFQFSMNKLTTENYDKLTDIGFESGFADQSHFIREFKRYTGQTPSYYLENIASNY